MCGRALKIAAQVFLRLKRRAWVNRPPGPCLNSNFFFDPSINFLRGSIKYFDSEEDCQADRNIAQEMKQALRATYLRRGATPCVISDHNSNEVRVLTKNMKFKKRCTEVGRPRLPNSQPVFVGSINKYISNYEEPFWGKRGQYSYREWKTSSKDRNTERDDWPLNSQAFTAKGKPESTLITTSKISANKNKITHSINFALPGCSVQKQLGGPNISSLENILHSHQKMKKDPQSNTDRGTKPNQTKSYNFSKLQNATPRNRLTLGNPLIKQDSVDRPKAKIDTVVGLDFVMGKSQE